MRSWTSFCNKTAQIIAKSSASLQLSVTDMLTPYFRYMADPCNGGLTVPIYSVSQLTWLAEMISSNKVVTHSNAE